MAMKMCTARRYVVAGATTLLSLGVTLAASGARAAPVGAAAGRPRPAHPGSGVKPKILFTGMPGFPILDPHYRRALLRDRYPVAAATYQYLGTTVGSANVLVVTMASPSDLPFAGKNGRAVLNFVNHGGGLLLMVGRSGYASMAPLDRDVNDVLRSLGAELLWQRVHDATHRTIFSLVLNYAFYSTRNIAPNSPLTRGIHRLWYPGGMYSGEIATYTAKVSSAWHVLVRGDKSASSASYRSAPPLVAVRSYGKGRIALVCWDPRYSINNGYHPAYGGYMLGHKGDGFRFMENLYDWLGRPSQAQGRIYPPPPVVQAAAAAPPHAVAKPSPPPSRHAVLAQLNGQRPGHVYRGVIGVRSRLSGGSATVAAFGRAARGLGLNFLVFAEDAGHMNAAKWLRLVKECRAGSSANFVAMPGLRVTDPRQGQWIVFNLARYPGKDEVGGSPQLLFSTGANGGAVWPTVIVAHPQLNRMNPWQLKFYTGLALVTYNAQNKLVDQAVDEYRRLVGSDYRLIPAAVDDISTLPGLRAAARGYLTYTHAPTVGAIPASLDTEYGSGSSFVSSGPVIEDFAEAGGYATQKYRPDLLRYSSALPGSGLVLKVAVASPSPLTQVTVYRNNRVFRRYFPHRRHFSKLIWAVNDQNGTYTLTARNAVGEQAISNQLHVYNPFYDYTMCVDKQNSILDIFKPSGATTFALFISGNANGPMFSHPWDTGQIMMAASAKQISRLIPAGVDASWDAINGFSTAPQFHLLSGKTEQLLCMSRQGNFSSPDCMISDNHYADANARARVRYVIWRPAVPGDVLIMVDDLIRIKKNIQLERRSQGAQVGLFAASSSAGVRYYSHYQFVTADGKKTQGEFHPPQKQIFTPLRLRTRQGGYAALWPNAAGNCAVYPIGRHTYDLRLSLSNAGGSGWNHYGNYIGLGYRASQQTLQAGSVLRAKFLFVLDAGKGAPADFQFIRNAYGLAGLPAYHVALQHGRVLGTTYALILQASNDYVRGDVSKAKLPDDHLGVVVKGVNDNWDAGIYDTKTRVLRRVGTYHGAAYVLLNTGHANDFIIGNLAFADPPFIKLTVLKFGGHALTVIAQNPADETVAATVGSLFSNQTRTCLLSAGGTATIHLARR